MRTQAVIEEYREKLIQLNKLENDAREAGLLKGPKRRGRKLTQYPTPQESNTIYGCLLNTHSVMTP